MDGSKESLEERLERIRLRNEEIEKKHREAEEDRIKALKDNALVELKAANDEDWPKAHKYDTLEFTYDVDPAKVQQLQQETSPAEPNAQTDPLSGRRKTFTDKDGPPPDPAYNFLADSERDGTDPNNAPVERKRDVGPRNQSNNKSSGSFRRQSSSAASANTTGGKWTEGNEFRKPLQFEIQPKKNLETNWRERDDGPASPPTPTLPPKVSVSQSPPETAHSNEPPAMVYPQLKKPLPLTAPPTNAQQLPSNIQRPPALRGGMINNPSSVASAAATAAPILQQNITAAAPTVVRQPLPMKQPVDPVVPEQLVVEQRGNIQISVKGGEIQSVKLTNPGRTTPGTGRVGMPRAITKQSQPPPAPAEIATSHSGPQILPAEAKNPNHFRIPNMAYPPPPVAVQQAASVMPPLRVPATTATTMTTGPPVAAQQISSAPVLVPSQDPPRKKFSVQDRLRIVPT